MVSNMVSFRPKEESIHLRLVFTSERSQSRSWSHNKKSRAYDLVKTAF